MEWTWLSHLGAVPVVCLPHTKPCACCSSSTAVSLGILNQKLSAVQVWRANTKLLIVFVCWTVGNTNKNWDLLICYYFFFNRSIAGQKNALLPTPQLHYTETTHTSLTFVYTKEWEKMKLYFVPDKYSLYAQSKRLHKLLFPLFGLHFLKLF